MCMLYFVSAAGPLPTIDWDADHPDVHVGELSETESAVVEHFTAPEVVRYLGSHIHCGCGFRCETLGAEPDEAEGKQRAHERLAEYLDGLPADVHPVQIYGCWSGDETEPTEHLRQVSVERLRDPDFAFRERELITIVL